MQHNWPDHKLELHHWSATLTLLKYIKTATESIKTTHPIIPFLLRIHDTGYWSTTCLNKISLLLEYGSLEYVTTRRTR